MKTNKSKIMGIENIGFSPAASEILINTKTIQTKYVKTLK